MKKLTDICYKALYNAITRSNYEKSENKRLIDKSQKLDSIVETMKDRGESEEYIAEVNFYIYNILECVLIASNIFIDFRNVNSTRKRNFGKS